MRSGCPGLLLLTERHPQPEPAGTRNKPWVAVQRPPPHLQRGTGGVVHIGQDLHGLLEHNTEGAGRTVAAETCVVLAKDCVAVRVDDLGTEAAQMPGSVLGKQRLQGLMRTWPGYLGMLSRWVWRGHGKKA